jgi:DNA polymerase-3 subunit alpha
VNSSQRDFAVVEGKIRFGLNAVKNVGEAAAAAIVAAREDGGAFASLWDFTERVDPTVLNKRALEALVKCGALDSTGAPRRGMLAVLDHALAWGGREQADRLLGQGSIFDLGEEGAAAPKAHPAIPDLEFEKAELLALEKESLGIYVSEHPLAAVKEQLGRKTDCRLSELAARRDGEIVTVGGMVGALKEVTTRKGDPMVFVQLDDITGSAEVVVFNSVYSAAKELLAADAILVVKGRVDHKQQGDTKLIAMEVTAFAAAQAVTEVRLKVDARKAPAGLVKELQAILKSFPGETPVLFDLATSDGPMLLELPGYRVQATAAFFGEVKALLGEAAVA